jgi:hypothetical protein
MIGSLFSKIGGRVGRYLGGGILSTIGRYTGRLLGDYLEREWFSTDKTIHKFVNAHDSFNIHAAKYGTPIPLVFGRAKIAGRIIWADQIIERANTTTTDTYIRGANINLTKKTTELEYFLSFAMAICLGKIEDIGKVWLGDEVIDISKYKFKLYKGDESQLPDPTIAKKMENLTPAYRGLAYIVFEELPLAEFGDIIPNLSFEIIRKPNIDLNVSVENMVESIVMIPGSGEFVYDTKIQTKFRRIEQGREINSTKINSHNHYNLPNSIYSLNQLKSTCPNVKWISPVVCWFGSSVDIKDCLIKPAVEFKNPESSYSEEWKVSYYTRQTADEIKRDKHGSPQYGGSVNDGSIIRYLLELKKRGVKIMFYPMFQMDIAGKPWRGKVTGLADDVVNFFNRTGGYNEFILHYAQLVKDYADAFIIGSELIGITKIRKDNEFPAVNELVKLAKKVKNIVGSSVKVSYAADWSEYHHTTGGWYNLDPLWSSPDIDFIGIDAYFPITDTNSSDISLEDIEKGFTSGEGYDYYYSDYLDNNSKKSLSKPYAWKNLKYWWENYHINPDKNQTQWIPKSKHIWFTEFGFPSIDKATNQPNIFFDNQCVDGGVPKYSNGNTNFRIQRIAIKAFIDFWKTQKYIGQMFLWCWDARPYPAWPSDSIWSDRYLWEKGHWVNYKFGSSSLASVLLEISNRCGIDVDKIDISTVDDKIEGLVFNSHITGINAINTLRVPYFFDINAHHKNIITFKKRGFNKKTNNIDEKILHLTANSFTQISKTSEIEKINQIGLNYINNDLDYNISYQRFSNEISSASSNVKLNLPILLTGYEAEIIGLSILQNAHNESEVIYLKVFDPKLIIKPSDFVQFNDIFVNYVIRVIDVKLVDNESVINGIVDKQSNYIQQEPIKYTPDINEQYIDNNLVILDLPMNISGSSGTYLSLYFMGKNSTSLYSKIHNKLDAKWNFTSNITPSNSFGEIIDYKSNHLINIFMIDKTSKIIISGQRLEEYMSNDWQYAIAGEEIIKFKNLKQLKHNLYEVSYFIRGLYGTEDILTKAKKGENFVIIEKGANILCLSDKLKNKEITFKAENIEKIIRFKNNSQSELKPFIIYNKTISNILHIKWVRRTKSRDAWVVKTEKTAKSWKIIITSNKDSYEYKTNNNEIKIDISNLNLSDGYKINIM